MKKDYEYSIVVPVYNTDKSLYELTSSLNEVFNKEVKAKNEIIFIDDASTNPNTWKTIKSIIQKNNNVKAIQFTRNFGQQIATLCGLKESCGKYVITMDDDLQHLPEEIPKLITKKNHDVVIAQFFKKRHSITKRLLSKIKAFFDVLVLGKPKNIQLSSFRLINRISVNAIVEQFKTPYPFLPAMIFYVTKDIEGVMVNHGFRKEGKSGYNLYKMIKLFSNLLINNSSLLLKIIGNIGFSIAFLSFIMGVYFILKKYFFGINVKGWTSLIVSILFVGGLMLLSIGIIGEYLRRIIICIDNKPIYVVRKELMDFKNKQLE